MAEEKEKTVLNPSVGADGGRPILCTENSISKADTENKILEESYEKLLRKVSRCSDPAFLPTISMNELYENVYRSQPPVIDGLLYPGTYLFAGSPKVGKSFFMAQLSYHVSTGTPLWDFQGRVLYLALEDDHCRLQKRLYRMFGAEGTDNLHFAVFAKQLGGGLEEQLKKFLEEHPDTRLVIIDTLQKSEARAAGSTATLMITRLSQSSRKLPMTAAFAFCWYITPASNRQKISLT